MLSLWNHLAAFLGIVSTVGCVQISQRAETGTVIKDSYIITLKSGLGSRDLTQHLGWVNKVHKWRALVDFHGIERTFNVGSQYQAYAGHFDKATIDEIRHHPEVAFVEEDKVWTIDTIVEDETLTRRDLTTQEPSTWALGAICHRGPGEKKYVYNDGAGKETFAYVIDTGMQLSHNEFEGRASFGFSAFPDNGEDTYGHGTHVAGSLAGITYGVAKKANLVNVKVFEGETGSTSVIMEGFTWAVEDILAKGRADVSVINMSLYGPLSEAFNQIVDAASEAGVLSVVAAGNASRDVSLFSPAAAVSAITVGAIDESWYFGWYSNIGSGIDVFAPGTNVESAWIGDNNATRFLTGTSMAAPHVSGLALYAITIDGISGVAAISQHIRANATPDKITVCDGCMGDAPNLVANSGRKGQ